MALYSPSLRADLRKLDEFMAQADLLCKYNIDTLEKLQDFIGNTKSQIRSLITDRDKIYIKICRNTDEETLPELIARRNEYTDIIKALHNDLKNANAIMERSDKVKGNIQIVQREELVNKKNYNNKLKNAINKCTVFETSFYMLLFYFPVLCIIMPGKQIENIVALKYFRYRIVSDGFLDRGQRKDVNLVLNGTMYPNYS